MPPFITGVSALNFTTRYALGGIDLSEYEEIGAGIRALHPKSSNFIPVPIYGKFISAIEYLGNGVVLVGTYSGNQNTRIYKSTDHGDTWSISATFTNTGTAGVVGIKHLGGNNVLVGIGGGIPNYNQGKVYRSTNAGGSWTLVNDWNGGFYGGHESVLSIEYLGNDICLHGGGYQQGDGSVWRSTDGGQTWTDLRGINTSGTANTGFNGWDNSALFDSGSPFFSATDSYYVSDLKYVGNGVVLANRRASQYNPNLTTSTTYPELIRSTDYGINWTKVSNTSFMSNGGLILENLGEGKVVGLTTASRKVYISENYGETWNTTPKFTVPRNGVRALKYLKNGHVILAAYNVHGLNYVEIDKGEIYESFNYGETWSSTPIFDPGVQMLMALGFNSDENTVYVSAWNESNYGTYKSGLPIFHKDSPILYKLGC